MKSRVFKTEAQIRRVVQDEARRQTTAIYEKAMQDAVYQAFAVMMCVLHREFGFGGKRLKSLKNLTETEFIMMRKGILGWSYNTHDCVMFLKSTYGIDFAESQYDDETWQNERRKA